ncbi:hypothetical protein LSM04_000285 [Trypanosoma melophagium]|uniref:uncharacterized protein n=1 Tax=Trypanosoma melophagium TaxID=715481 RepID=UPI00351A7D09|nr:hypothetical protein LSM04_000285 [Trypanosoma melophagium]
MESSHCLVVNVVKLGCANTTKVRLLHMSGEGSVSLSPLPVVGNESPEILLNFVVKRFIPLFAIDTINTYAQDTILHMTVKREHDIVLWKNVTVNDSSINASIVGKLTGKSERETFITDRVD